MKLRDVKSLKLHDSNGFVHQMAVIPIKRYLLTSQFSFSVSSAVEKLGVYLLLLIP
jgi:hypothetical protein